MLVTEYQSYLGCQTFPVTFNSNGILKETIQRPEMTSIATTKKRQCSNPASSNDYLQPQAATGAQVLQTGAAHAGLQHF